MNIWKYINKTFQVWWGVSRTKQKIREQNKRKKQKLLYLFFMVGVMIPVHCTIVPISSIASSIGAKNSYWFLVLVYTAFNLAQAVYLYIGFIQGIDKELDEAAIIDGCNDVSLLTKILAPICKPIIATETIFVFI